MRRSFGMGLRLGVAAGSVSLWRSSRWRAPAWTLLREVAYVPDAGLGLHGDFAALGQALEQVLPAGQYARWPLSVVLDDALARLWQVDMPQGAARLADRTRRVVQRLGQLAVGARLVGRNGRNLFPDAALERCSGRAQRQREDEVRVGEVGL